MTAPRRGPGLVERARAGIVPAKPTVEDIIRAELRANYASWGLSRAALANLLEGEARALRELDADDLRREQKAGR